MVLKGSGGET